MRPALKRKYAADLEALYESHNKAKDDKIEALKDPKSNLSTFEKLVVLLESQLGIEGLNTSQPFTFNELGGDSLGAALFSMSIEEIFEVPLVADVIYHQDDDISLDKFVDWIESAGHPIHRITDHRDWVQRIKDKLTTLPDHQRQQSMLDLLPAFSRPYPTNLKMAGCDNFKQLVHQVNDGKDVPSLSEIFIHKCLKDLVLHGRL